MSKPAQFALLLIPLGLFLALATAVRRAEPPPAPTPAEEEASGHLLVRVSELVENAWVTTSIVVESSGFYVAARGGGSDGRTFRGEGKLEPEEFQELSRLVSSVLADPDCVPPEQRFLSVKGLDGPQQVRMGNEGPGTGACAELLESAVLGKIKSQLTPR